MGPPVTHALTAPFWDRTFAVELQYRRTLVLRTRTPTSVLSPTTLSSVSLTSLVHVPPDSVAGTPSIRISTSAAGQQQVFGSFRMKSTSDVMENSMQVHGSIKPPVWSPASSSNLSDESTLARWAAVCGFVALSLDRVRARYDRPHSPPAKLDSDKIGNTAADQTCWLD